MWSISRAFCAIYAAHGFRGALGKPYRIEEVSEALRRALGSKSSRLGIL